MWKDFFYYTKSERRAILFLSCIGILLLAYGSWQYKVCQTARPRIDSLTLDSFQVKIYNNQKKRDSLLNFKTYHKSRYKAPVLTEFDPNTADSSQLCNLGLPPFLAKRILNYRNKGGKFKTSEDFSRIYGLTEKQYSTLKPYIRIDEKFLKTRQSAVLQNSSVTYTDTVNKANNKIEARYKTSNNKYPAGTVLDLNTADTTQLKRIPGIGKGLAKMIVSYRNRLGGFSRVEQLQEIEHLDSTVNTWFTINTGIYRKIRINHDKLDKLRNHPYMNFYKAKVILEFRRKRGKIKGLPQLSMFQEFTEEDLQKLKPYLDFE